MKINVETKFEIGEEVLVEYFKDEKVPATVTHINVAVRYGEPEVIYDVRIGNGIVHEDIRESWLYKFDEIPNK